MDLINKINNYFGKYNEINLLSNTINNSTKMYQIYNNKKINEMNNETKI
jgi:hypothetical protein